MVVAHYRHLEKYTVYWTPGAKIMKELHELN
jgi:hypothetical protein